jgi:hypothetical protein
MALDFPPDFPFNRSAEKQSSAAVDTSVDTSPAMARLELTTAIKPAVERRRAPRQTLVAKASIRPDTNVQMASMMSAGFVSNISMNGVGFHTRKPMAVGEKYRITLELGPMKWSSRMRIVSCRHHPESETFDVGAEFVGNELSRQAA